MQRRNTAYNRISKTSGRPFRAYSDTTSRTIGLSYEQKGAGKAAMLRVLLPFVTRNGNVVPTDIRLTGAQARRLYEFLSVQYGSNTNTATNENVSPTPIASTPVRRKRSTASKTTTKRNRTASTTKRKRNA